MSISLVVLMTRLQSDVPEKDSIPDDDQYRRCIQTAVDDYGRRNGVYKIYTLSVVDGTATYSLPDDFVSLIRMESLMYPDSVHSTAAGLVPLSSGYQERYTIANGQITFYPTPTYNAERYLHYMAGWSLDNQDVYQEMGEAEAEAILLEAGAQALTLQANYFVRQAWQYSIGDERVSKERLSAELRAQAQELHARYVEKAAKQAGGVYGSRSEYPSNAYQ